VKRRRLILVILLLLLVGTGICLLHQYRQEQRFGSLIRAAAKRHGVDPLLVKAVIWHESRFNPDARGRHGEIGLMQIQEIAAQEWADAERDRSFIHAHCADPGTNLLAATYYLGKLLKRYPKADNPVPYALADYNAGRANVLKWNTGAAATNSALFVEQIGFPQTRRYVRSVMRRQACYRVLAELGWNP